MDSNHSVVEICREMLADVASEDEYKTARKSVAESMARLFPGYKYTDEYKSRRGKILIVTYVYKRKISLRERFARMFERARLLFS